VHRFKQVSRNALARICFGLLLVTGLLGCAEGSQEETVTDEASVEVETSSENESNTPGPEGTGAIREEPPPTLVPRTEELAYELVRISETTVPEWSKRFEVSKPALVLATWDHDIGPTMPRGTPKTGQ